MSTRLFLKRLYSKKYVPRLSINPSSSSSQLLPINVSYFHHPVLLTSYKTHFNFKPMPFTVNKSLYKFSSFHIINFAESLRSFWSHIY